MAKDLLLEIGTEELPASFIEPALEFMKGWMVDKFKELRLSHGDLQVFGTPRRLAVEVHDIQEKLPDTVQTKVGPPKKIAFDDQGRPTQAAIGFAKSLGVSMDDISFTETEKGTYLCFTQNLPGKKTEEVLGGVIGEMIPSIPFKKTMRWSNPGVRFARPVHWILALFGSDIVEVRFGNIISGNKTRGNRFMEPGPFDVPEPSKYETLLEGKYVIPDIEKRKDIIKRGLQEGSRQLDAYVEEKDLLEEVTQLVEYPYTIIAEFENRFLRLPKEVLVTVMKHHQRFFPVYEDKTKTRLRPYFLSVCNIKPRRPELVKEGNERVLKARLEDASYFFDEDLKVPLEEYAQRLKGVIFHKDLGTSFEKVERFRSIALYLADFLAPDYKDKIDLTARLSKADLNSLMVQEFPELQGIMGKEYALQQGYDPEVATAIYEHYLPLFAGDTLPSTIIGDIVGIADRIDTICGCFSVGMIPTGTSDPYALRRQAIAILNILLDKGYRISLPELVVQSLTFLSDKLRRPGVDVQKDILEFFRSRLVYILQSKGIAGDIIEAVLGTGFDDPLDTLNRAKAISSVRQENWFDSICIASKRVENILKKKAGEISTEVSEELLRQEQEKNLYNSMVQIHSEFQKHAERADYEKALRLLSTLKDPIDSFFDDVLVMTDHEATRRNRLALLKELSELFGRIAKFSYINTPV